MTAGRIDIVGLGPAGIDMMLPADRSRWDRASVRFLRTVRHPAVRDLVGDNATDADDCPRFEAFDAVYEAASTIESVYELIAERVVAAARLGDSVVYAVPGNPRVAERAVALICDLAGSENIPVTVHPAIGIDDIARARMGAVDHVADGHAPETLVGVDGAVLVTQVDSAFALSDVKLELLDDGHSPTMPIAVLRHLGAEDESISWTTLVEVDREPTDHLTSLWFQAERDASHIPVSIAAAVTRLLAVAERLRGPDGCLWDAEQTHVSLRRYVLEEAHEVVEVLDQFPSDSSEGTEPTAELYDALEDELGDLLYQVVFHSVLANETGAFTFADVANRIHDKLVRRHPHVFGDATVTSIEEANAQWEAIKAQERAEAAQRQSAVD